MERTEPNILTSPALPQIHSMANHINNIDQGEDFNEKVTALKDWRKAMSEELGQPLYIVLQNKTIEQLASKNPESIEDLKEIYGIGEVKAENFGDELLGVLIPAGEL